jgi:plastocyanin
MTKHTIQIDVDDHNNMTYTPSMLRVAAGDTVQWVCRLGPFAVMLKDKSPFNEGMDTHACGGTLSEPMWVADVKGEFHYAVAVYDGSRVHMDAGCPMILAN